MGMTIYRICLTVVCIAVLSKAHAQPIGPSPDAERHMAAGAAAHKAGDLETALQEYFAAYSAFPEGTISLYNIALVYRDMHDKEKALEMFKRYLRESSRPSRERDALSMIKVLEKEIAEERKADDERRRLEAEAEKKRKADDERRRLEAEERVRRDGDRNSKQRPWYKNPARLIGGAALFGVGVYLDNHYDQNQLFDVHDLYPVGLYGASAYIMFGGPISF